MKYWELTSAFREFSEELNEVLCSNRWYSPYGEWFGRLSEIIEHQDQEILDHEVPDKLVIEVAKRIGDKLILYKAGSWLRSTPGDGDIELNALDVMQQFGGGVIEEVIEYGSAEIKT